ncbi:hypothetical protein [Actinomadura vinacea]
MSISDGQGEAVQHLENLRLALNTTDPALFVRLVRAQGEPPYLHVNNPAGADRFAEDIGVRPAQVPEDPHRYVWSWGEEITSVTTPEIAAQRVRNVLAVHQQQM